MFKTIILLSTDKSESEIKTALHKDFNGFAFSLISFKDLGDTDICSNESLVLLGFNFNIESKSVTSSFDPAVFTGLIHVSSNEDYVFLHSSSKSRWKKDTKCWISTIDGYDEYLNYEYECAKTEGTELPKYKKTELSPRGFIRGVKYSQRKTRTKETKRLYNQLEILFDLDYTKADELVKLLKSSIIIKDFELKR